MAKSLSYLSYPRNTTLWKISGTDTFRLSSTELFEYGTNVQNPDKRICRIYWADKDRVFVQVDQSGAEALLVSYEAEHGRYRDLFLNGIKPHQYLGLYFPEHWIKDYPYVHELVNVPISELGTIKEWAVLKKAISDSDYADADKRYYYLYKQTCHSGNYDVHAPTFRTNILVKSEGSVVLTMADAEKFLDVYNNRVFPEIPKWRASIDVEIDQTKTLRNLFGYPRTFYSLRKGDYKQAYAFKPQSTVGTITNIAYTNLQNYIEDNNLDWDLLINKHDSYLVQCRREEAKECAIKMKEFMNQKLVSSRGETFYMKSEAQCGLNWAPFDKDTKPKPKNPMGLGSIEL